MPTLDGSISDFVQGDTLDIKRNITNLSGVGTIAEAWLSVKQYATDVANIFQKHITITPSTDGEITDTGGSGTGIVVFHLSAADTSLLLDQVKYVYDIQVKMSGQGIYTPERGVIVTSGQITTAS